MIKLPRLLRPKRRDAALARPFFDAEFYRTEYPDVAAGGADPLLHYLDHGWREGRNPSAVFGTLYYADRHLPDGVPENPLTHYARLSPPERLRVPTRPGPDFFAVQAEVVAPYFDARFYSRVAGLEEGGADPLQHYLTKGWRRGLAPNEAFDGTAYLQAHAHVRRLDVSPFYHFVSTRRLNPAEANLPERRATGEAARLPADPTEATDAQVYEAVAAEFDKAYYLDRNADIRHSGVDPIRHFLDFGVREDRDPNPHFSIRFYRSQYRREIAAGVNPFFHYLAVGRARGFKPNAYGRGPWPAQAAPSEAEWGEAEPAADLEGAHVVLIMPVYKGLDDTLRSIHSVLSAPQATPFALLVIDDASPEPALSAALAELAGRGLFVLERNTENLGFVRTCNRGLDRAGARDVVLLNADIVVFGDWLDRLLRHAADDSRIATVTPFSNNATICSYPVFCIDNQAQLEIGPAEIDAYAAACNAGTRSTVPTGVGFCFYMRRAVIDAVGPLDAETFGRGYGEENDFCMRALKAGFSNVLAHDVFVFHSGSVSFGALIATKGAEIFRTVLTKHADYQRRIETHIQVDPARFARRRLDHYRFARRATADAGALSDEGDAGSSKESAANQRPGDASRSNVVGRSSGRRVALIVTHDFGGGIETHVEAMSARLAEAGLDAVYLRTDELTGIRADLPEASRIDFPASVLEPISLAHETDFVAELIGWLDPALVHVHSLAGLDWPSTLALMDLIRSLPTGYDATLHDYSAVCHRNHLVRPEGTYCGLPAPSVCRDCIRVDDDPESPPPDPDARRRAWADFLGGARRVYAPSRDLAARIEGVLGLQRIALRPHEEHLPEALPRPSERRDGPLRVAVIGSIGVHKGFDIVHDAALDAQLRGLPIGYTIIGHSYATRAMEAVGVRETGRYGSDAAALAELARLDPDLILLPSIWPETYCYTLSLALAAGVPPAVFDLGAQAERLADLGQGFRLDPALVGDPQRLNAALLALPLDQLRAAQPAFRPVAYPRILKDYYDLSGAAAAGTVPA